MATAQTSAVERVVGLAAVAAAVSVAIVTVWPAVAQSNVTAATTLWAALAVFFCAAGLGYLTGTMTPLEDGINLGHVVVSLAWGGYTVVAAYLVLSGGDLWEFLPALVIGIVGSVAIAIAFVRERP